VIALAVLICFPEHGHSFALAGAAAYAVELPLYKILKNTIKRDRPFAVLAEIHSAVVPIDRFSFPSGHTAAAVIMATLLAHFFPMLSVPAFIWAALVAFSRIYLGVHYPTDTVAGVALGFFSAQVGLALL
jgi:undecaprenyl-diphosphatase